MDGVGSRCWPPLGWGQGVGHHWSGVGVLAATGVGVTVSSRVVLAATAVGLRCWPPLGWGLTCLQGGCWPPVGWGWGVGLHWGVVGVSSRWVLAATGVGVEVSARVDRHWSRVGVLASTGVGVEVSSRGVLAATEVGLGGRGVFKRGVGRP